KLGNPLDPKVTLGPMVRTAAADQVRAQVRAALAKGARALLDLPDRDGTPYLPPQVLVDVDHGMEVMSEETFGPVVGIMPLEGDDVVGRFREIKGGYREMFAALLPGFTFQYYEAHRGQLPASPRECDAWMCTGSKYSAYDGTAWIADLATFIRSLGEKRFVG